MLTHRLAVDVGEHHAAALGSEEPRDAGSEPRAGAGHHNRLSLQAHDHPLLSFRWAQPGRRSRRIMLRIAERALGARTLNLGAPHRNDRLSPRPPPPPPPTRPSGKAPA